MNKEEKNGFDEDFKRYRMEVSLISDLDAMQKSSETVSSILTNKLCLPHI